MKKYCLKILSILFLFSANIAFAQQFHFKADLDSVKETRFYTIQLVPSITSHLKTDFSDLRIADEKERWAPHIIRTGITTIEKENIIEFPIISNRIIDSGKTELIVENKADTFVSVISLFLKNMAVSRTGIISGSNDQQHWFIISPVTIDRSYETSSAEYLQELQFNPSDYKYFKIVINNLQNDPVNILHAGLYAKESFHQPQMFFEHEGTKYAVKDSANQTFITITEQAMHHIGRIQLNINGPKFYARSVSVYLPDATGREVKFIASFELLQNAHQFEFPVVKTKQLLLVIENKDNPPLAVSSVVTAEPLVKATAYLEAGHQYHLLMGNDSVSPPDFDLVRFKDSIPANTTTLQVGKIMVAEKLQTFPKEKSFFSNWIVWPILLLVLLLLFMLVKSLLNDVNKTNQ